jgi:hypothetical protein
MRKIKHKLRLFLIENTPLKKIILSKNLFI